MFQVGDKIYPLIVKRIVPLPAHPEIKRADAIYYDHEAKVWREVVNDADRETIAQLAAQGVLSVTTDQSLWPENQVYY